MNIFISLSSLEWTKIKQSKLFQLSTCTQNIIKAKNILAVILRCQLLTPSL